MLYNKTQNGQEETKAFSNITKYTVTFHVVNFAVALFWAGIKSVHLSYRKSISPRGPRHDKE